VGAGSAGAGLELWLLVESETPPHAVRAIIAKTTKIEMGMVRFIIFFSFYQMYDPVLGTGLIHPVSYARRKILTLSGE